MARKMTIAELVTFVGSYVDAAKQAGTWNASFDNLLGLIDKVGMQISLDGSYQDKLPELEGNDLPLGKTIEEWFVDLVMPTVYDADGENTLAPAATPVQDPSYSYTLGRRVAKVTERFDNIERAAISSGDAANMTAKILERLTNSVTMYRYAQKKQLLGNFIAKATTANRAQVIAKPTDTSSAEAFIKQIKEDVEAAAFASENTSLSGTLIGSAPSLVLYVKKGVMPTVEVDALAGAFNAEKLAIPATIKVVDDFGNADAKVYAMLIDPRGVKLHTGYHAVRNQENAEGDFINFYDHSENTGFISKHTFVKVYKDAE